MSLSKVFDRAGDLVEAGWIQNYGKGIVGEQQCYCARFALVAVTEPDSYRYLNEAELLFHQVIGADMIVPWNDTPGRTQQEVVAAFREAAKRAALTEGSDPSI